MDSALAYRNGLGRMVNPSGGGGAGRRSRQEQ